MSDITPHILAKRIGESYWSIMKWLSERDDFREFCGAYKTPGGYWRISDKIDKPAYVEWCKQRTESEIYGLDDCA